MVRILGVLLVLFTFVNGSFGKEELLRVSVSCKEELMQDGWINVERDIWEKKVDISQYYAENNAGKKVATDFYGQKTAAITYTPYNEQYTLMTVDLNDNKRKRMAIAFGKNGDIVTFRSRFYFPSEVYEVDKLGRVVREHREMSALQDWYEADGFWYEYTYYADTKRIKSLHIYGYGEFPGSQSERDSHKDWGTYPMYDALIKTEYDPIAKTSKIITYKKVNGAYVLSADRMLKAKWECNLNVTRDDILERDMNGNPYKIKGLKGNVFYMYYFYE